MLILLSPFGSQAKPKRGPKFRRLPSVPPLGIVSPATTSPGKKRPGGALTKRFDVVPLAYSSPRNWMLRSFKSVIGVYGSQRSPNERVKPGHIRNVSAK